MRQIYKIGEWEISREGRTLLWHIHSSQQGEKRYLVRYGGCEGCGKEPPVSIETAARLCKNRGKSLRYEKLEVVDG